MSVETAQVFRLMRIGFAWKICRAGMTLNIRPLDNSLDIWLSKSALFLPVGGIFIRFLSY